MASESPNGGGLSEPLPDDLTQWLDERAADRGVSRSVLLERLVDAYRLAVESEASLADADDLEAVVERLVEEQEAETGENIAAVEEDFESRLDDVRRRIIQLKKETEGKAEGDHSHREFTALDDLETAVADLREDIDSLQSTVADHDTTLDDLEDTVEGLDEKLTRVAHAVVQLRSAGSESGTLDALKHEAALEGIDQAKCGACDKSVNIALLTEAACPHCDTQVRGVEPASGFFGKPHLTGERTDADE